jgi:hypothetical protein
MNCEACNAAVEGLGQKCPSCGAEIRPRLISSPTPPVRFSFLRIAGVFVILTGIALTLGQHDAPSFIVVAMTTIVSASLLFSIAEIRDATHATWKRMNRLEEELSKLTRRP